MVRFSITVTHQTGKYSTLLRDLGLSQRYDALRANPELGELRDNIVLADLAVERTLEAALGSKGKNMNLVTILGFVNVFFAGILAGEEIVIHYGLRAPAEALDARSHIQLRKALVLRLRVLVPAFFVPTAVSGIAVTVLDGAVPGFWFRCAGVLALFTDRKSVV